MHLPEDDEHSGLTPTVVATIVAVTLFVGAILVMVLLMNNQGRPSRHNMQEGPSTDASAPPIQDSPEDVPGTKSTLTPDDLTFWDKYPPDTQETDSGGDEDPSQETAPSQERVENDPSTDGKHTLIKHKDGTEEWVLISPYLPKNTYDFTKLVCQSNLMKYYEDGKQVSFVGVDISKNQDYVDFVKLRKAGIDFVMLRVGARGYGSGQLVLDDYFSENIKRATDAGLDVGVYFFSQAVTEEEAIEEANMVLENIGEYSITYPVAFDMEYIENDVSRIDTLSKSEKTAITKAFLETVKAQGYKTIIYGDKEWLMRQIDMSKLTAYDIWLSQKADIPDYPYQFTMWQYNTSASIDGIAGSANLNISFIDYSEK